jgi:hypothetical protein
LIGAPQRCCGFGPVEPGGVPWAGGSVSWRAAPSGLQVVAFRIARRMEVAGAARRWTASSPLKATRGTSDELTVLYSNGPADKHGALQGAWRWQAVPARKLSQVG